MAVTDPIMLDSTGQDMNSNLLSIDGQMTNLNNNIYDQNSYLNSIHGDAADINTTLSSQNTAFGTLNSKITDLITAVNNQTRISSGTTDLEDGVSPLPSGQVYLQYME